MQGFPVQVAYGSSEDNVKTFEIKPLEVWQKDTYLWDYNAESMHGLYLDYLKQHGIDAISVAEKFSEDLKGQTVYADSNMDLNWLFMLLDDCAEITRHNYPMPAFQLISELYEALDFSDSQILKSYLLARQKFKSNGLSHHKANNDVLMHIWQWNLLRKSVY